MEGGLGYRNETCCKRSDAVYASLVDGPIASRCAFYYSPNSEDSWRLIAVIEPSTTSCDCWVKITVSQRVF